MEGTQHRRFKRSSSRSRTSSTNEQPQWSYRNRMWYSGHQRQLFKASRLKRQKKVLKSTLIIFGRLQRLANLQLLFFFFFSFSQPAYRRHHICGCEAKFEFAGLTNAMHQTLKTIPRNIGHGLPVLAIPFSSFQIIKSVICPQPPCPGRKANLLSTNIYGDTDIWISRGALAVALRTHYRAFPRRLYICPAAQLPSSPHFPGLDLVRYVVEKIMFFGNILYYF